MGIRARSKCGLRGSHALCSKSWKICADVYVRMGSVFINGNTPMLLTFENVSKSKLSNAAQIGWLNTLHTMLDPRPT